MPTELSGGVIQGWAEGFQPLIEVAQRDFYGSFPSGHTTLLAALGSAVFFTEKIPGTAILFLAVAVGLRRQASRLAVD